MMFKISLNYVIININIKANFNYYFYLKKSLTNIL